MNLEKFAGKKVKFTLVDERSSTGFVYDYTSAINTDDELYDEIVIIDSPEFPWYLGLSENEIKSIEII